MAVLSVGANRNAGGLGPATLPRQEARGLTQSYPHFSECASEHQRNASARHRPFGSERQARTRRSRIQRNALVSATLSHAIAKNQRLDITLDPACRGHMRETQPSIEV